MKSFQPLPILLFTALASAIPSSPPRQPRAVSQCTIGGYNKLMFSDSIPVFLSAKSAKSPDCWNWSDDGCSCSPDDLGEFDFLPPCQRHDFGYRSAKKLGIFNDAMKKRVDDNFKDDLYDVCKKFAGWQSYKGVQCRRIADIYVAFVRKFGKKKKRDVSGARAVTSLVKRDCDLLEAIGLS